MKPLALFALLGLLALAACSHTRKTTVGPGKELQVVYGDDGRLGAVLAVDEETGEVEELR